tara:strand:+ start:16725 stop:17219 length:495 start_codon:yes stop_codon:yes gene_type:complete
MSKESNKLDKRKKKAKVYQKKYLAVRRKRYAEDKDYRDKILDETRESYASNNPNFKPKGFGENAGKAGEFAVKHEVIEGVVGNRKVLAIPSMAKFIGVVPKVLNGWVRSGKFPTPTSIIKGGVRVYTIPQANALAYALKAGLKGRAVFRATYTDVIAELRHAIK